jgi:hypothetical protein
VSLDIGAALLARLRSPCRYPGRRGYAQKAAKETKTDQELGFGHDRWVGPSASVNSARLPKQSKHDSDGASRYRPTARTASGAAEITTREPTLAARVLYPSLCVLRGLLPRSLAISVFIGCMAQTRSGGRRASLPLQLDRLIWTDARRRSKDSK